MLKKLIRLFIILFVGVVIITLAVANRHTVTFVLDPFSAGSPALTLNMPLFVFLFAALFTGLILGGFATWVNQSKWRKKVRQRTQEAYKWRGQAEQLKQQINATRQQTLPPAVMSR